MKKPSPTLHSLVSQLRMSFLEFGYVFLLMVEPIFQRALQRWVHYAEGDERCMLCGVWTDLQVTQSGTKLPICTDCMTGFLYCPRCYQSIAETGERTPGGLCSACRAEGVAFVCDPEEELEDEEEGDEEAGAAE
jgi:hypothetical protein